MDCSHRHSSIFHAAKEVAELTFCYQTVKCDHCSAVLWTSSHENEFQQWLNANDDYLCPVPDLILNDKAEQWAEKLANSYGCSKNDIYKSCLQFYFNQPKLRETIDLTPVTAGLHVIELLSVNLKMFVQLEANANLFDVSVGHVSSWIILHLFSATTNDKSLFSKEIFYQWQKTLK